MSRFHCALLCALLVLSTLNSVIGKRYGFSGSRSGGHHYPSSGGLSGGGSRGHSYPSSGGLSGHGTGSHSSSGSHAYPSSGHGYPASGGLSGGGKGYPSSSNTHHTNNHGYPAGSGLSGNQASRPGTTIINHYHYNPPSQISYRPHPGAAPINYPVYHGTPPTYVYQYKDSGSKYGTLLAGLALLNLGAIGTTAYLAHKNQNYKQEPGEICKFGVRKENGDYEETRIDCALITSFIFAEEEKRKSAGTNTTITSTTVTNVTTIEAANPVTTVVNPEPNRVYEMLPNGTMVLQNATVTNATAANVTSGGTLNNTMSVTTITNTTTVTNALDVKGKPVDVTPGMQCYVIRHSSLSNMKKSMPCGVLQTYADKSIKPNSASRATPALTVLAAMITAFAMY